MSGIIDSASSLVCARAQLLSDLPMLQDQLKDTNIDLDERWEAFTLLVNNHILVNVNPYGDGYASKLTPELSPYDDLNMERVEEMKFTEMYDTIMDADPSFEERLVEMQSGIKVWQEHVLQQGYSAFCWDW